MFYYFGAFTFFLIAILCIVAFVKVKKRDAAYGRGEGLDD